MTYQMITTPLGETLVVLPLADFEALCHQKDSMDHRQVMKALEHGDEEILTAEEAELFLAASTPLAFWRKKRKLTQKQLAESVGISQGYVASLEAGTRSGDAHLTKRLAHALKVSMDDLVP
jgi:DNA-binding XRE family transcriptional regulator